MATIREMMGHRRVKLGTFLVELQNPATVPGWDPSNVASLIYDLDESGGC